MTNYKQQKKPKTHYAYMELMRNQEPYPDEMFEEAERREAERKALTGVCND